MIQFFFIIDEFTNAAARRRQREREKFAIKTEEEKEIIPTISSKEERTKFMYRWHVSSASIPTIAGFEQNDPEQTTGKPKHQLAIHLVMDSF